MQKRVAEKQADRLRLLVEVAGPGAFVALPGSISVAVSGGSMGKSREPQIILKTDQRNVILEMSQEGKFTAKSSSWMRTGSSLRTTSARSRLRTAAV